MCDERLSTSPSLTSSMSQEQPTLEEQLKTLQEENPMQKRLIEASKETFDRSPVLVSPVEDENNVVGSKECARTRTTKPRGQRTVKIQPSHAKRSHLHLQTRQPTLFSQAKSTARQGSLTSCNSHATSFPAIWKMHLLEEL